MYTLKCIIQRLLACTEYGRYLLACSAFVDFTVIYASEVLKNDMHHPDNCLIILKERAIDIQEFDPFETWR